MQTTILILSLKSSLKWETVRHHRHSLQSSPQKSGLSRIQRHHTFLTTSSQTPKNKGLQSAEEQNHFPKNKMCQKPKIADRLKRICRQKLLSSWSPLPATAPSKTRWTIHCGIQQDLAEGGTRSPPTTDPPAAKELQQRRWGHFQSQKTAEPNVSRSDKERESRKENTVSSKQITDQNEPQPEN